MIHVFGIVKKMFSKKTKRRLNLTEQRQAVFNLSTVSPWIHRSTVSEVNPPSSLTSSYHQTNPNVFVFWRYQLLSASYFIASLNLKWHWSHQYCGVEHHQPTKTLWEICDVVASSARKELKLYVFWFSSTDYFCWGSEYNEVLIKTLRRKNDVL